MNYLYKLLIINSFSLAASLAAAQSCPNQSEGGVACPTSCMRAPLSVMGDHMHSQGEWMLSYRHMRSNMQGMRQGSNRAADSEVASVYNVVPQRMDMQMDMLGIMYAPSDDLTVMLMAHYHSMEMENHRMVMGSATPFTTQSAGWGDTKLSLLQRLLNSERFQLHAQWGLSLPTGSIKERDLMPAMGGVFAQNILPASMQLGSGTFDFEPVLTLLMPRGALSYGAQVKASLRLESENSQGYRRGHQLQLQSWASYQLHSDWTVNTGLSYHSSGKLQGEQQSVTKNMMGKRTVPTAWSENYGGDALELLVGSFFDLPSTYFPGQRIAVDVRLPLYQNLNGVQMDTDWKCSLGWELRF
jgi:hypothetical protein